MLDGLDPDRSLWTLKISSEQHGSCYCIKLALGTHDTIQTADDKVKGQLQDNKVTAANDRQ